MENGTAETQRAQSERARTRGDRSRNIKPKCQSSNDKSNPNDSMTNEGDLGMGIEPKIRRTGPQGKPEG